MARFARRLLLLCCFAVCCYGGDRKVTVRAVEKLPEPLTVGDLERRFGPPYQGHGPLSFYPCADRNDMEIRFWWHLTRSIAHSADKRHSMRNVPIAFVTLAPSLTSGKERI